MTATAPPYDGIRQGSTELNGRLHRHLDDLFERCQWYELALMRHGWTGERLQKEARGIVRDQLTSGKIHYLTPERHDDLVDYMVEKGLQATLRFRPEHQTKSYGSNGGRHFDSWICDILVNRCVDWLRSKHEGNGDRRYGNDGRIVLSAMDEDEDVDVDFDRELAERTVVKWKKAATVTGLSLEDWVSVTLNKASERVLRTAA